MGTLIEKSTLLDFALISNMGMSVPYGEIHIYTYLSANGQRVSIRLSCTDLFDRSTEKWIVREEPPQEEAQALPLQGYQPQEIPQYPSMGSYPYGYYPGGGSGGVVGLLSSTPRWWYLGHAKEGPRMMCGPR